MIENIFTATPAEIDIEIASLQAQAAQIEAGRERCARIIQMNHVTDAEFAKANADMIELSGKAHVLNGLIDGLTREYERRGRWSRYYVVDNNNGHLHTHTECQNTYETTQWVWMPGMSGMTKAEAVAEGGKLTCLSCFPEFREEIEAGREPRFETPRMKKTREEREALAAKKAEKAKKAAANGITAPDGSPLLDDEGYAIKTLRSAEIKAVQALEQAGLDEIYADQCEADETERIQRLRELAKQELSYADRLIHAIAAKRGHELAFVADEIKAKADKKLAPARKDEAARKAAGKTAQEWYAAR